MTTAEVPAAPKVCDPKCSLLCTVGALCRRGRSKLQDQEASFDPGDAGRASYGHFYGASFLTKESEAQSMSTGSRVVGALRMCANP